MANQTNPVFSFSGIFQFIKNNLDPDFRNPCDTPMLKKLFRAESSYNWNMIENDTVDEIIFMTSINYRSTQTAINSNTLSGDCAGMWRGQK